MIIERKVGKSLSLEEIKVRLVLILVFNQWLLIWKAL